MKRPVKASDIWGEPVRHEVDTLRQENDRLSEQVKRLVKTEHELYQFQDKLDVQVRIYRHLYELGKRLNATLDLDEVLQVAVQFVLYQLNFQRSVTLLYEPATNVFRVRALDGYYDDPSRGRVSSLHLSIDDPALAPIFAGSEELVCAKGCEQHDLLDLGRALEMDEYVAFPFGRDELQRPMGLLVAGNTIQNNEYHTPVQADSEFVVGLANLVAQVATAIRMRQEIQAREQRLKHATRIRERIEQELRVARLIQQALLPKTVPIIEGWEFAQHYQPAREVGGDFYDFLQLADGRVGLIIGDVSGKGVPAAVLMASTRSVLRAIAQRGSTPGQVLAETNEILCYDVPPNMFITCYYGILDPMSGRFRYANAGHSLPYWHHEGQANELRATGMPLGLLAGMNYEEEETIVMPGDNVLFYSDGLVEAHSPQGEMFGTSRLQCLVANHPSGGSDLTATLLAELTKFTGAAWEQEDDLTCVSLRRYTV